MRIGQVSFTTEDFTIRTLVHALPLCVDTHVCERDGEQFQEALAGGIRADTGYTLRQVIEDRVVGLVVQVVVQNIKDVNFSFHYWILVAI